MPAKPGTRRSSINAAIAAIARHNPDDPRLTTLREQCDAAAVVDRAESAVADLTAFINRARVALLPLSPDEIADAGRKAAMLDARRPGRGAA